MKPQEFIDLIAPAAVASRKVSGVPASFTIAEAALESGWGSHAPGNNLFGVKADSSWHGEVTTQTTREVLHGQPCVIRASFRAYPDWQGCMDDHAAFLHGNARYRGAFLFANGIEFAKAVAAAGYATDPKYAELLGSIIKAHNLVKFDQAEATI